MSSSEIRPGRDDQSRRDGDPDEQRSRERRANRPRRDRNQQENSRDRGRGVDAFRRMTNPDRENAPDRRSQDVDQDVAGRARADIIADHTETRIRITSSISFLMNQKDEVERQIRAGEISQEEGARQKAEYNDAITNMNMLLARHSEDRLAEALSAQVPEALQVPTKEKVEAELRKSGELGDGQEMSKEVYEKFVNERMQAIFETLEMSDNQTFEEQTALVTPIVQTYTHLMLSRDTESLGRQIKQDYETRRNLHRQAIIWRLNVLEGIFQGSSGMDTRYFANIFTTETTLQKLDDNGEIVTESRHLIAEQFKEMEKMGQRLLSLRKKSKNRKNGEEAQSAAKLELAHFQKEISDFYLYGGYMKDANGDTVFGRDGKPVTYAARAEEIRERLGDNALTAEQREKLETDLDYTEKIVWARKMAGRLFSITGRAGRYDIILNGLGDIFSTRLLNFEARLSKDPLHDGTKELWNPSAGPYKGKRLDVGARDFMSALLSKVSYRDDELSEDEDARKGDIKLDTLSQMGIRERDLITEKVPQKEGDSRDRVLLVGDLSHANIENPEFWKELFDQRSIGTGDYGSWIDNYNRADLTRKSIIGFSKFANAPNLENYLKLGEVYENYSGDAFEEGGGDRFSEKQRELYEVLDRTLSWGKRVAIKDKESDWAIFPAGERYDWIDKAYGAGMITENQRKKLFRRYVNVPVYSWINPVGAAGFKKRIDLITAPFRSPMLRGQLISGSIMDSIKAVWEAFTATPR